MQRQKPVCSIFTTLCSKYAALCCNFFLFWTSTPSRLIYHVKSPLFLNFQLNTTYCRAKSIMLQFFFFWMSTPSRLICQVKLPLFLNFQVNTTHCRAKSLYAAFWQLYAANMQHYAAKNFFADVNLIYIYLPCEITPIPKFLA